MSHYELKVTRKWSECGARRRWKCVYVCTRSHFRVNSYYLNLRLVLSHFVSDLEFCGSSRISLDRRIRYLKIIFDCLSLKRLYNPVPIFLFCAYWLGTFGHWAFANLKQQKAHHCPSQEKKSKSGKTKQKALLNETNLYEIKQQSELSRFMPAKTKKAFIGLCWILVLWLCRNTAVRLYRDKLIVCPYLDCAVKDKASLSAVTFVCVRLIMKIL